MTPGWSWGKPRVAAQTFIKHFCWSIYWPCNIPWRGTCSPFLAMLSKCPVVLFGLDSLITKTAINLICWEGTGSFFFLCRDWTIWWWTSSRWPTYTLVMWHDMGPPHHGRCLDVWHPRHPMLLLPLSHPVLFLCFKMLILLPVVWVVHIQSVLDGLLLLDIVA